MSTSRPFIYADHAASTPLAPEAWEAMKPFLLDNFANPSSLYALSRPAKKALMAARETIAECLGAEPDEILFTSGGTESDNWALKGSVPLENAAGKTSFVTSKIEHHAVLRTCRAVEGMGVSVDHLPVNGQGEILPEVLKERISGDTRLVSVMLANNEIGTIQPIRELAEIAHAHGAVFHTDAVQAVGHIPVNVRELGVELLSASAHKFNGPRGAGFLYVKRGTPLTPYLDGGAQEFGMRAGTENTAAVAGMAAALKKNCTEMKETAAHLRELEKRLLTLLAQSGQPFTRNGGRRRLPGLLSLSFPEKNGEALLHRLDLHGICVSTGAACDSQKTQTSHVLTAIALPEPLAVGTLRVSFGRENTLSEAETIAQRLDRLLKMQDPVFRPSSSSEVILFRPS
ncbi:MAG: cysteine desulfurase [Planctomycetaceae bacterium]|nr:cysteine desulfurase [Planctomycetaceae bacterium]